MLKEHQPNFDLIKAAEDAETLKWQNEIRMLERRPKTEYEEVDLGGGDKLAIRTAITVAESRRIAELEKERKPLDPEKDQDRLNEIQYEILEIMTANPLLTRRWFAENQDRYSLVDALQISLAFHDFIVNRAMKRQAVGNFRKDE